jgi:hypothetical protein
MNHHVDHIRIHDDRTGSAFRIMLKNTGLLKDHEVDQIASKMIQWLDSTSPRLIRRTDGDDRWVAVYYPPVEPAGSTHFAPMVFWPRHRDRDHRESDRRHVSLLSVQGRPADHQREQ